jgi:hypothetical protein
MEDDSFAFYGRKSLEPSLDGVDDCDHFNAVVNFRKLSHLVIRGMAIKLAEPVDNGSPRNAVKPSGQSLRVS